MLNRFKPFFLGIFLAYFIFSAIPIAFAQQHIFSSQKSKPLVQFFEEHGFNFVFPQIHPLDPAEYLYPENFPPPALPPAVSTSYKIQLTENYQLQLVPDIPEQTPYLLDQTSTPQISPNHTYSFILDHSEKYAYATLNFDQYYFQPSYFTFTLTFPDRTQETYYNVTHFTLLDLPAGFYQYEIQFPKAEDQKKLQKVLNEKAKILAPDTELSTDKVPESSQEIQFTLLRAEKLYPLSGSFFFTSEDALPEKGLSELPGIIQKGNNLWVVSNPTIAAPFGIQFKEQTFENPIFNQAAKWSDSKSESSLLPESLKTYEVIEVQSENLDCIHFPLVSIQDKLTLDAEENTSVSYSLLEQFSCLNSNSKSYTMLFISQDLFNLPTTVLDKIFSGFNEIKPLGPPPSITEITAEPVSTSLSARLYSMASFFRNTTFPIIILFIILLSLVLILLFSQLIHDVFLDRANLKFHFQEKNERWRMFARKYLYPILFVLIVLIILGAVGFSLFYKWYTTASGLDLLPDFKISEFVSRATTQGVISLVLGMLCVFLFLLALFLWWLFPSRLQSFLNLLDNIFHLKISQKLPRFLKQIIFLTFLLFSILFLYSYFLHFPFTKIYFSAAIILGLLNFLFLRRSKESLFDTTKLRFFLWGAKALLLLLPLILLVNFIRPHVNFSTYNRTFTLKIEEKIDPQTGYLDFSNSLLTLISPEKNETLDEISRLITGPENTVMKFAATLPTIKLDLSQENISSSKQPFSVEIKARLKSNQVITLHPGTPLINNDSIDLKYAYHPANMLFYFPFLSHFTEIGAFNSFQFYQNKKFDTLPVISASENFNNLKQLPDLIKDVLPTSHTLFLNSVNLKREHFWQNQTFSSKQTTFDNLHLKGGNLTFYTYLDDGLDFKIDIEPSHHLVGSLPIDFVVTQSPLVPEVDNPLADQDEYVFHQQISLLHQPQTLHFQKDDLPAGVYGLHFLGDPFERSNNEQFIIHQIQINSPKLVMKSPVLSDGTDTLYFKNFSPSVDFKAFHNPLSFSALGGGIRNLSLNQKINSLDQITFDSETLWRIYLPAFPGEIFDDGSNLYAFTQESWFNPFAFQFMNSFLPETTEFLILENPPIFLSEDDFTVSSKNFQLELSSANPLTFTLSYPYSRPNNLMLLDSIEVTLQEL